jgi:hypothetical protein
VVQQSICVHVHVYMCHSCVPGIDSMHHFQFGTASSRVREERTGEARREAVERTLQKYLQGVPDGPSATRPVLSSTVADTQRPTALKSYPSLAKFFATSPRLTSPPLSSAVPPEYLSAAALTSPASASVSQDWAGFRPSGLQSHKSHQQLAVFREDPAAEGKRPLSHTPSRLKLYAAETTTGRNTPALGPALTEMDDEGSVHTMSSFPSTGHHSFGTSSMQFRSTARSSYIGDAASRFSTTVQPSTAPPLFDWLALPTASAPAPAPLPVAAFTAHTMASIPVEAPAVPEQPSFTSEMAVLLVPTVSAYSRDTLHRIQATRPVVPWKPIPQVPSNEEQTQQQDEGRGEKVAAPGSEPTAAIEAGRGNDIAKEGVEGAEKASSSVKESKRGEERGRKRSDSWLQRDDNANEEPKINKTLIRKKTPTAKPTWRPSGPTKLNVKSTAPPLPPTNAFVRRSTSAMNRKRHSVVATTEQCVSPPRRRSPDLRTSQRDEDGISLQLSSPRPSPISQADMNSIARHAAAPTVGIVGSTGVRQIPVFLTGYNPSLVAEALAGADLPPILDKQPTSSLAEELFVTEYRPLSPDARMRIEKSLEEAAATEARLKNTNLKRRPRSLQRRTSVTQAQETQQGLQPEASPQGLSPRLSTTQRVGREEKRGEERSVSTRSRSRSKSAERTAGAGKTLSQWNTTPTDEMKAQRRRLSITVANATQAINKRMINLDSATHHALTALPPAFQQKVTAKLSATSSRPVDTRKRPPIQSLFADVRSFLNTQSGFIAPPPAPVPLLQETKKSVVASRSVSRPRTAQDVMQSEEAKGMHALYASMMPAPLPTGGSSARSVKKSPREEKVKRSSPRQPVPTAASAAKVSPVPSTIASTSPSNPQAANVGRHLVTVNDPRDVEVLPTSGMSSYHQLHALKRSFENRMAAHLATLATRAEQEKAIPILPHMASHATADAVTLRLLQSFHSGQNLPLAAFAEYAIARPYAPTHVPAPLVVPVPGFMAHLKRQDASRVMQRDVQEALDAISQGKIPRKSLSPTRRSRTTSATRVPATSTTIPVPVPAPVAVSTATQTSFQTEVTLPLPKPQSTPARTPATTQVTSPAMSEDMVLRSVISLLGRRASVSQKSSNPPSRRSSVSSVEQAVPVTASSVASLLHNAVLQGGHNLPPMVAKMVLPSSSASTAVLKQHPPPHLAATAPVFTSHHTLYTPERAPGRETGVTSSTKVPSMGPPHSSSPLSSPLRSSLPQQSTTDRHRTVSSGIHQALNDALQSASQQSAARSVWLESEKKHISSPPSSSTLPTAPNPPVQPTSTTRDAPRIRVGVTTPDMMGPSSQLSTVLSASESSNTSSEHSGSPPDMTIGGGEGGRHSVESTGSSLGSDHDQQSPDPPYRSFAAPMRALAPIPAPSVTVVTGTKPSTLVEVKLVSGETEGEVRKPRLQQYTSSGSETLSTLSHDDERLRGAHTRPPLPPTKGRVGGLEGMPVSLDSSSDEDDIDFPMNPLFPTEPSSSKGSAPGGGAGTQAGGARQQVLASLQHLRVSQGVTFGSHQVGGAKR